MEIDEYCGLDYLYQEIKGSLAMIHRWHSLDDFSLYPFIYSGKVW